MSTADNELIASAYFEGEDERWGVPLGMQTHSPDTEHDLVAAVQSCDANDSKELQSPYSLDSVAIGASRVSTAHSVTNFPLPPGNVLPFVVLEANFTTYSNSLETKRFVQGDTRLVG